MLFGLNLLHLLLALGAAGCVRLALREIAGRSMSPSRLAALPLLALAMTFAFLLFFASLHQPLWLFAGALLAAVCSGALARHALTVAIRLSSAPHVSLRR